MAGPLSLDNNNLLAQMRQIFDGVASGRTSLVDGYSQLQSLVLQQTGLDQLMASPSPLDRLSGQNQPAGSVTVQRGDTLDGIARAHGTDWQTLARINGLSNPDLIHPGQQVRLPGSATGSSYTVQRGDTLSEIAQANNTSVAALARANNIANPDRIYPGQQLTIPDGNGVTGGRGTTPGNGATPQPAPVEPTPQNPNGPVASGQINLDRLLDRNAGSQSLGAIIIGNAEGTRTPAGGTTRAYGGHIDPGNQAANVGSFSLQNAGGMGPEAADRTQLGRLAAQRPAYEAAARAAGLDPNNATLATAYFDLYNQSPRAAGRFLDQLGTLREAGISQQSVTQLRVNSFIDPATGERYRGAAGGFVNIARERLGREPTAAEIRATVEADQSRRQRAMVSAMDAQGIDHRGRVAAPEPRDPAPANGMLVNPTGGALRNDSGGEGHFGASRRASGGGTRAHMGLDLLSTPGQDVRAPISGTLTVSNPGNGVHSGFRITADDGTVVKVFYANPDPSLIGRRVNAGDTVATAQDLQLRGKYPANVQDHVHLEVLLPNGRHVDPAPLVFGR